MLLAGTATLVSAVINPVAGDPDSTNNYITLETLVVNSCDPNNKLAFPEGDLTVGQVSAGIDINYTINFQNTGTAEAINITILDPIDINLDLSTLYITGSSHPISSYSILPNRTLRFIFENINLPDSTSNEPGSHGFVGFQISPYQNLSAGTVLSNTAYNYFDNNLPIPTNTIVHTVDIAIGLEEDDDNLVLLIYPNPASQVITVHVPEGYEMWEILNIYGQTVRKGIVELYRINFEADISELSAGIYQVRITGNNNHPLTTPLLIAR
jgi:uncharacterized repeat protein (TIGR01451 family)